MHLFPQWLVDVFLESLQFLHQTRVVQFLQDVLLKRFTLVFSRFYSDIKGTSQRNKNIMILGLWWVYGGPR